jgi:small-conductance mechanosensitive channel
LPALVGGLLWLILGWIIARVVQAVVAGLLRRIGFDRVAERAGIRRWLVDAGLETSTSYLVARLTYWLILLLFVLAAAESLGLAGVVDTLEALIAYLPNVLAAVLILLLGSLVARVVGDAVGALTSQAGVTGGAAAGRVVNVVLLIFVVLLALGQLGIETTLLTTVTTVLITATALALALAFGLGSRDLARNIMAGMHAREAFAPGQEIRLGDHQGQLVDIGAVKTVIATEGALLSLPNARLVEEAVTVLVEEEEVAPGESSS